MSKIHVTKWVPLDFLVLLFVQIDDTAPVMTEGERKGPYFHCLEKKFMSNKTKHLS